MKKAKLFALLLACTFIFAPILHAVWIWAILADNDRAWKMFNSFDKFANGAFNGNPAETISERAAKGMQAGSRTWCVLCKFLHLFDRNHCEKVLTGNTPRWATVSLNSPEATANDLPGTASRVLQFCKSCVERAVRAWRRLQGNREAQ